MAKAHPRSASPGTFSAELRAGCRRLAARLRTSGKRLVLAESCTAGLVAATLAQTPGISAHFCGSVVTYRNDSKARWLRIDRSTLRAPGPVSRPVARQMAVGVLRRTPEADLAGAVTGHLGPGAPSQQDGVIFVAVAWRRSAAPAARVAKLRLTAVGRTARQREAALRVVEGLLEVLQR